MEPWSELQSVRFKPLAPKSSGLQRKRRGSRWFGWEGMSVCTSMCTNSSPDPHHSVHSSSCCPTELDLHVGKTWDLEGSLITQPSSFQNYFGNRNPSPNKIWLRSPVCKTVQRRACFFEVGFWSLACPPLACTAPDGFPWSRSENHLSGPAFHFTVKETMEHYVSSSRSHR